MGKIKHLFIAALIALMALAIGAPASLALAADPGTINAIRVDRDAAATVYAATSQAGVLKSADNGATWTAKNAGLPSRTILDLAIDPFTPGRVYIVTESGVFRSENGGDSWNALDLGNKNAVCSALTVDAVTPGLVFVGTQSHGVYGSADAGDTWTFLEGGAMRGVGGLALTTLDQAPTMATSDSVVKVFKTMYVIDSEGVWKNILGFSGLQYQGRLVLEQEWNKIEMENKKFIYALLARASVKYDGKAVITIGVHEGGLYMLEDGTGAWRKIETPQKDPNINGLAGSPEESGADNAAAADPDQDVLYASSYDGFVMKGVEQGGQWSWTELLNAGILGVGVVHPKTVTTQALSSADGAVSTALWVGTFSSEDGSGPIPATIYRSPDDGRTWSNALAGGWSE